MLIFLKKKKKKIPISPARISRKNSPSSVEGTDARPRAQNQSPRAQTRFYSVVGLASSSSSSSSSSQRASSFFGVLLRVFFLSSHPSAVSVSPRSPFEFFFKHTKKKEGRRRTIRRRLFCCIERESSTHGVCCYYYDY